MKNDTENNYNTTPNTNLSPLNDNNNNEITNSPYNSQANTNFSK